MGFFSSRKASTFNVVLDIGSKSVGGAIFVNSPTRKTLLLYTTREPIAFQEALTGGNLFEAMHVSLRLILARLEKYFVAYLERNPSSTAQIDSVSAVMSSPWHTSETKILKLDSEKELVLKEEMVNDLLSSEEKGLEAKFQNNVRGRSFGLLEHKIIDMRLNGYSTARPYGKKIKDLEMSLFVSVAAEKMLGKVRNTVLTRFASARFAFHTFTLASFTALRDFFPAVEHFLILQVGGEVTDITVVKGGVIAETLTFPLGHNSLLRALNKICANEPKCSLEGLLALHRDALTAPDERKKVERAIGDAKTLWLGLFNDAISNFSEEMFLPKRIFLFEDDAYAPLFQEFVSSVKSSRFTVSSESFTVTSVGTAEAGLFTDVLEETKPDAVLGLEAHFVSRLRE